MAAALPVLEIRLDRSSRRPSTQQGFWLIDGTVVSECVLAYPEFGDRREFVPRSTIAAAATSLLHVPLTIEHEAARVDPDNFTEVNHGHVTESRITADGANDFTLLVGSRRAMDAIDGGTHYLSPSYHVDLVAQSGTSPAGEPYNAVQARRVYNNLTITKRPRAGERATLRLDGLDAMKRIKITIHGKTHDAPELLLAGLRADADALTKAQNERKDAEIKVGKVKITMSDGQTVELTLPDGTINDLLKMLGAGSAPVDPAKEAAPDPAATPAGGMEMDAKTQPGAAPPKMDSVQAHAQGEVDRRVAAAIGDSLRTDARRRDTESKARSVLGPDRQLAGLSEGELMVATIAMRSDAAEIRPIAETLAKRMVDVRLDADARGEARGRLASLFESTCATLRTDRSGPHDSLGEILASTARSDSAGQERTDKVGDARQAMIKRQTERYKGPKRSAA